MRLLKCNNKCFDIHSKSILDCLKKYEIKYKVDNNKLQNVGGKGSTYSSEMRRPGD